MNFLNYFHGMYPDKGYLIYNSYGYPHYLNSRSDPYLINPNYQDFKGLYWRMPHDRKIIRI